MSCIKITNITDILNIMNDFDVIAIDEGQFF